MRRSNSTQGSIIPTTLLASAIVGLLTIASVLFMPKSEQMGTRMFIEPAELTIETDQSFTIDVIVESPDAVNAFAGILNFDEAILEVDRIGYNTSIADLWTQEPWFAKGDGTITFAGGTTKPGGFSGKGSLLTVVFRGKGETTTALSLTSTRILKHDGLGTDAQLQNSLDALFTIKPLLPKNEIITQGNPEEILLSTDLNNDNSTSLADISIFMVHITSQNLRSDFNNDKKVTAADLSILLEARGS